MKKALAALLLMLPAVLSAQWDEVTFSKKGGVYDRPLMLTLQCGNTSHHIRYTLNGATPTASSRLYTSPMMVNRQLYSTSTFYQQHITPPDEEQYVPDSILRAVVIRAAVFDDAGNRISPVATNSYFIQNLGCDFDGLPVVSLCADSADLFSDETGILVPGIYHQTSNPDWTGNYYKKGRDWERLCNVEYYDDNGGFNQQAGLRTHGGNGRRFDQKGLKIYAREEYGKKRFSHKIYEDLDIRSFKHLVLKPFISAWTDAGIQDMLGTRIAGNLDLDILASRPVVLFLNGEYWGIYYLHEKADDRYVEDHYYIHHDLCNVMGNWFDYLVAGESTQFARMMEWLETADLSDPVQYRQIADQIDIGNFTDYQILELFIANSDWPANNMRCWQAPSHKWRWIFYDGDGGFSNLHDHMFETATSESTQAWPTNARSTLMFRRLLQNQDFKAQFVERFNTLSDTYLSYRSTHPLLKESQQEVEREIPRQRFRFGRPESVSSWKQAVSEVDRFLQQRQQIMTDSIRAFFNLSDNPSAVFQDAKLYPQPASGQFYIEFHSDYFGVEAVRISDMLGRVCYSGTFVYTEGKNTIPIRCNLRSGAYIVTFGKVSRKLMVAQ